MCEPEGMDIPQLANEVRRLRAVLTDLVDLADESAPSDEHLCPREPFDAARQALGRPVLIKQVPGT